MLRPYADPAILEWLDSDDGQLWLNNQHRHVGWNPGFASIKYDDNDTSAGWRWRPGECVAVGGHWLRCRTLWRHTNDPSTVFCGCNHCTAFCACDRIFVLPVAAGTVIRSHP